MGTEDLRATIKSDTSSGRKAQTDAKKTEGMKHSDILIGAQCGAARKGGLISVRSTVSDPLYLLESKPKELHLQRPSSLRPSGIF